MTHHITDAQIDTIYTVGWTFIVTMLTYIDHHLGTLTFLVGLPLVIVRTMIAIREWNQGRRKNESK